MNNLDKNYIALLNDIMKNGTFSGDRTGTGTKKVFGRVIRHDMTEGFPLLTTKKMFYKGIIHELLWFLKGDTNIKYLVDNGVYIWIGDCYKKYKGICDTMEEPDTDILVEDTEKSCLRTMTEKEFIEAIKLDYPLGNTGITFAQRFGELNKVYGSEWIDWYGINQVQELVDTLKNNPDSRRMMVTAWNPVNVRNAVLPPCHYTWQVFTRELNDQNRFDIAMSMNIEGGIPKLENSVDFNNWCDAHNVPKRGISLMYQMRSVDTGLGMPFDIASYGFLLSMIAQCVNMHPEELISSFGDTHIYMNQLEDIKAQLDREPFKLPKLELNKDVKNIFDFKFEDIKIVDYVSHDAIKLQLSN
jgi:thymidylate synthase